MAPHGKRTRPADTDPTCVDGNDSHFNIDFEVPLNCALCMVRSSGQILDEHKPLHHPHDVILKSSLVNNKIPWKCPGRHHTSNRASAKLSASLFFRATASGYLVGKATTIRTYHFPLSDTGEIGPFKSTAALQNGTLIRVG